MTEPPPEKETLHSYLYALYCDAGRPSLRITGRHAGLSHSSVGHILSGQRRHPTWPHVESMVTYLGGDVDHAKTLWDALFLGAPVTPKRRPAATMLAVLTDIRDLLASHRELLTEIRDRLPTPDDYEDWRHG